MLENLISTLTLPWYTKCTRCARGDGPENGYEEPRERLANTARKVPRGPANIGGYPRDPAILRPNGNEGLVVVFRLNYLVA